MSAGIHVVDQQGRQVLPMVRPAQSDVPAWAVIQACSADMRALAPAYMRLAANLTIQKGDAK